jgi:poly(A) polymerase
VAEPDLRLPEPVLRLLPTAGLPNLWLVGGSVRDLLIGRPTLDFDFAVQGDAPALGRRFANELGADYFDLDPVRGAGRVLLTVQDGQRATMDFAGLRGETIENDLALRDFTINAMAIRLAEGGPVGGILDPLGGARDLRESRLRLCSPSAVDDDPVRALRAVRFAVDLNLALASEGIGAIRRAAGRLSAVSAERTRDEIFRLIGGQQPGKSLRLLDELGLLTSVVPELEPLRGLRQPEPHAFDALEHSLKTVDALSGLIGLVVDGTPEAARDLSQAEALLALAPYRESLRAYLAFSPSYGRARRSLLYWAALLHDIGKAQTQAVVEGRIRFLGHEAVGGRLAVEVSRRLRLSVVELAEIEMTVLHHMRPEWLETGSDLSSRAVYRFFRATESAGVSVVLLSLGDRLAREIPPIAPEAWRTRLATAQRLFQAWFVERETSVAPSPILTGDDVMALLRIAPGPDVGRILETLREAQVAGEVQTRDEGEAFVRRLQRED